MHHDDAVGPLDCREAVRDHERRTVQHQTVQRVPDAEFRVRVDARGRLIQNQDPRTCASARAKLISCFCPVEKPLPRSRTCVSNPLRQPLDEIEQIHLPGTSRTVFVANARRPSRILLVNGARK